MVVPDSVVNLPTIWRKATRFFLVGVVGALFDYGTRTLLLYLGIPAFLARGGSFAVGSAVAYYLNSFFTFQGDRSQGEKVRATVVYTVCFCVAIAVDLVIRRSFDGSDQVLFWSWFFSQAVATLLNFSLQNIWVFQVENKR